MADREQAALLDGEPDWVARIHRFWFGEQDVRDPEYEHLFARWYRGGPKFDDEVRADFEPLLRKMVDAEQAGELDRRFCATARSKLALVLLLDQMPRNMYRGSAKMFETDPIARAIVEQALEDGAYQQLVPIERLFLCVALEHAEDVEQVRRSARLMRQLAEEAPDPQRRRFLSMCRYNRQHLDIVEAFGRYPHRNRLLGRQSTPQEVEFLANTNYRFMRSVAKGYR